MKDGIPYRRNGLNTPEEEAITYNVMALELHGEFACLKEIPDNLKPVDTFSNRPETQVRPLKPHRCNGGARGHGPISFHQKYLCQSH